MHPTPSFFFPIINFSLSLTSGIIRAIARKICGLANGKMGHPFQSAKRRKPY